MNLDTDSTMATTATAPALGKAASQAQGKRSAVGLFRDALRERPVRTGLGLGVEYAMFASGMGLALSLFVTRVPLRLVDRAFGLSLRERFIELIARLSPG
jgi:hypothetical protein